MSGNVLNILKLVVISCAVVLVLGAIFVIPIISDKIEKSDSYYYYDDVNTKVKAVVDDSVENPHAFDTLLINDERYILLKDEYANLLHACDETKILSPFANFGDDVRYTLYEVQNSAGITILADNHNRALFCKDTDKEKFYNYYGNDDVYDFGYRLVDENNSKKLNVSPSIIEAIKAKYDELGEGNTTINPAESKEYAITKTSKDNLMTENVFFLIENKGVFYLPPQVGNDNNCIKLDKEYQRALKGAFCG